MSEQYISEPQTNGKVILHTTAGDVEIELWGNEAPKATRNFIQLCLEGYYDDTIFHRIVPRFIIQGGDPTGSGHGGSSIYDEDFTDEFHSRLRFNRRGLVGMANSGRNTNGSQFFFTLDEAMDLTRKNTMFGKVVGDTVFNVLKMGEAELGDNERPIYPPKIKSTEVIINPFDDIFPRKSELEELAERERERAKEEQPKKKKKETKKLNLLSFGDEANELEPAADVVSRTKMKSSHDFVDGDKVTSKELSNVSAHDPKSASFATSSAGPTSSTPSRPTEEKKKRSEERRHEKSSKEEPKKLSNKEKIEQLQNEIKNIRRVTDDSAEKEAAEKRKMASMSLVEQERQKFLNQRRATVASRKGKSDDKTLQKLNVFWDKLGHTKAAKEVEKKKLKECDLHGVPGCESCFDTTMNPAEEETDEGWMGHTLKFEKDYKGKDLMKRIEKVDDYVVIDPRDRQAAALQEEYTKNRKIRTSGDSSRKRDRDQERSRDRDSSRHDNYKRSRDNDRRR